MKKKPVEKKDNKNNLNQSPVRFCKTRKGYWCPDTTGATLERLVDPEAPVSGPSMWTHGRSHPQAGSLSTFQNCSLTSVGRVLKRSSSTTRPVLFSCRHSPSSTGRHSRRFPLSSSCVSAVSSPKRDGTDCRQLLPKFSVRSFLHWNSSLGRLSICSDEVAGGKKKKKNRV